MDKLNIVIAGVGGQGTLLASRWLGCIAENLGLDVKISEVHGMSQRGGSVVTYVRMAPKVFSALIEQKGADYILAFEQLEALRVLPYVREGGTIFVNTQKILPMPVIIGSAEYPENIPQTLRKRAQVVEIDALKMARKAGNERTVNTVLIGALAAYLPYSKQIWQIALEAAIPEQLLEVNRIAFEMSYDKQRG